MLNHFNIFHATEILRKFLKIKSFPRKNENPFFVVDGDTCRVMASNSHCFIEFISLNSTKIENGLWFLETDGELKKCWDEFDTKVSQSREKLIDETKFNYVEIPKFVLTDTEPNLRIWERKGAIYANRYFLTDSDEKTAGISFAFKKQYLKPFISAFSDTITLGINWNMDEFRTFGSLIIKDGNKGIFYYQMSFIDTQQETIVDF